MFNKATFREIIFPSLGNANDYVHIFIAYLHDWKRTIKLVDLRKKKLHSATN